MGRFAQAQRHGKARADQGAPVLVVDGYDLLWSWSGSEPTTWHVDYSTTGGAPWDTYSIVPGSTYVLPNVDTQWWYRVAGFVGASQVTPWSNVVLVPV